MIFDRGEPPSDARTYVTFDPNELGQELIAFGEIENALMLSKIDADDYWRISILASRLLFDHPVYKALCLAAVEVLEGAPRPLKRKRRILPKP